MKSIAIYRLGSLGDTVVALPCFHAIARRFPEHKRIVLTNFPVSSKAAALELVLGRSGLIDDTVRYPIGIRNPFTLFALRSQLLALDCDTLVYLAAPRGWISLQRDTCFFRLCGFKNIIGIPLSKDLRTNRIDPETGLLEPEAERLTRTLSKWQEIDLTDRGNWDLCLTCQEWEVGDNAINPLNGEPFFTVNLGGKDHSKDWGEQNWIDFLSRIYEQTLDRSHVVFLGAQDDVLRADRVIYAIPQRALNLCGELSPRESGAVAAKGRFFVGHDSGPMHLAAAVGVPCLGLFGSLNRPKQWHPYGEHHRVVHKVQGIGTIAVTDLVAAFEVFISDITPQVQTNAGSRRFGN